MKKLLGNIFLLLAMLLVGCGKEEDPKEEDQFDFLSCRLLSVSATGSATFTDTFTYNSDGQKISVVRPSASEAEVYTYAGKRIVEIVGNYYHEFDIVLPCIREISYDSDKISQVTVKDPGDESLLYTDDYEWSSDALTITRKNSSSEILSTREYEFDDDDIMNVVYTEYNGTSVWYKEEWEYDDYDNNFNPEYLIEYPFPASLHNYNQLIITITDYSGGGPVSEIVTFDYTVTLNESNAVEHRERVGNDGATLIRNYSYDCE